MMTFRFLGLVICLIRTHVRQSGRWLLSAIGVSAIGLAEVAIKPNDMILFYGNSMVERLLEHGELEAWLQLAHPGKNLKVRSLAWAGDEVGFRLRPDGYAEHLKGLLGKWPANIVVLGFGMNESFAGQAGLKDFRTQLDLYLREIARRHPDAQATSRLTSPCWPNRRRREKRSGWISFPPAAKPTGLIRAR
jgi:hypothetical protein